MNGVNGLRETETVGISGHSCDNYVEYVDKQHLFVVIAVITSGDRGAGGSNRIGACA